MHDIVAATLAVALLAGCAYRPASRTPEGPTDVSGLPLVEVEVVTGTGADAATGQALAVLLTGDGGWARLDRTIGERIAEGGIPVIGFNSRRYLERRRTPEETAEAVARVIRHYTEAWHRRDVVLVGYSRGADLLPFVVNRLPPALRERVRLVALLGVAERAGFEFHWLDLIGVTSSDGMPILPEVERLTGTRVLCVYGRDEAESLCRQKLPANVTVIPRDGGHHFDGDYRAIADLILEASKH